MKKLFAFLPLLFFVLLFACSEQEIHPVIEHEVTLEKSKAPVVPFNYSFDVRLDEVLDYVPNFSRHQILQGSGNATHLGLTTYRLEETIDMTVFPWTALAHVDLTAANGDMLTIEYSSSINPETFPDLSIEGAGMVIGGTGRGAPLAIGITGRNHPF